MDEDYQPEIARQIRSSIISSLGRIGADAVPAMLEAFKGNYLTYTEKTSIITRLGDIGSGAREAIPFLDELASSSTSSFASYARQAIKRIQQTD